MPFVTIGGITLHHRHVKATGNACAIIFINSLGTDFRIWDDVVAALDGEMSLLVYDKRGHGLSDIGDIKSIDDHVDDLSGLIDHFGWKKVVLCGLSVGGMIAQALYARRPGIVEALILCDTAHKIGTNESWNTRIAVVERTGIQAFADSVLKLWFTPAFHTARVAELDGYWNMMTRQAPAGYLGTCAAIRAASVKSASNSLKRWSP